jgi:hypothetical protein
MTAAAQNPVTEAHRRQFREQGWFLLPGVVPAEHLAMMRTVCGEFIAKFDAEMDAAGETQQGINIKGSRYFISLRHTAVQL